MKREMSNYSLLCISPLNVLKHKNNSFGIFIIHKKQNSNNSTQLIYIVYDHSINIK